MDAGYGVSVLELGQPDLQRGAADVRVGVDVLGEGQGERGRLADAGFHAVARRTAAKSSRG